MNSSQSSPLAEPSRKPWTDQDRSDSQAESRGRKGGQKLWIFAALRQTPRPRFRLGFTKSDAKKGSGFQGTGDLFLIREDVGRGNSCHEGRSYYPTDPWKQEAARLAGPHGKPTGLSGGTRNRRKLCGFSRRNRPCRVSRLRTNLLESFPWLQGRGTVPGPPGTNPGDWACV